MTIDSKIKNVKIDNFFKRYNGKAVDYDNCYGVQCFDLANQFCKDVAQCPPFIGNYAYEIYTNYDKQYNKRFFKRIKNTPLFVPKKGDIVVWDKKLNNKAGHVAIATGKGNIRNFEVYEENWLETHDCTTKRTHNYKYVLGVLRLR